MAKYDLIVIGAGSGGYVAAIRAAQLGAKVAVVEKESLGGTCLNRGCIPTKTLINSTRLLSSLKEAGEFGVEVESYKPNFPQMIKRKDQVVQQLVQGIAFLFKKHKIDLIKGKARLEAPGKVKVKGDEELQLEASNLIIATGSEPVLPPIFNYDGERILSSKEALELQEVPASMLIVGGGVIGCEFASIFARLGTEVSIVELLPQILPGADPATAKRLAAYLQKMGIKIRTKTRIEGIEPLATGIEARLDNGEVLRAEKALIAVGRRPVTRELGLEELGIELGEKGGIIVNERMETNIPGIYAVGDVNNQILLAHVASTQGIVAAENIMGKDRVMDYRAVPSVVFTDPELATVGLSYKEAKKAGYNVVQGRFSYRANGKALAMGETEGMVSLVVEQETDIVLGGQVMGAEANNLIAELTLAVQNKLTATELAHTIHAHPTLAEVLMEAAENAHGLSIHG